MALNTKLAPVDIDISIDKLQQKIYAYFVDSGLWTKYESYPRAYINEKDGLVKPQAFLADNDYKGVLMDDKFNVSSFFIVSDEVTDIDRNLYQQDVSIIFQVNLKEIYPLASDRDDKEFIQAVSKVLRGFRPMIKLESIKTGIDSVYSEFDTDKMKDGEHNMQPYYVVRFDLDVRYSSRCNAGCALRPTVEITNQQVVGVNDGEATVNSINVIGTLSYLWSNGATTQTITDLAPGPYSVQVTDDGAIGCRKSASGVVEAAVAPPVCNISIDVIVVTNPTTVGGSDGTATATVTGNAGIVNHVWEDGQITNPATGLSAGDICLAVSDNGVGATCLATKSAYLAAL